MNISIDWEIQYYFIYYRIMLSVPNSVVMTWKSRRILCGMQ